MSVNVGKIHHGCQKASQNGLGNILRLEKANGFAAKSGLRKHWHFGNKSDYAGRVE
jgi:hypothetical protein